MKIIKRPSTTTPGVLSTPPPGNYELKTNEALELSKKGFKKGPKGCPSPILINMLLEYIKTSIIMLDNNYKSVNHQLISINLIQLLSILLKWQYLSLYNIKLVYTSLNLFLQKIKLCLQQARNRNLMTSTHSISSSHFSSNNNDNNNDSNNSNDNNKNDNNNTNNDKDKDNHNDSDKTKNNTSNNSTNSNTEISSNNNSNNSSNNNSNNNSKNTSQPLPSHVETTTEKTGDNKDENDVSVNDINLLDDNLPTAVDNLPNDDKDTNDNNNNNNTNINEIEELLLELSCLTSCYLGAITGLWIRGTNKQDDTEVNCI